MTLTFRRSLWMAAAAAFVFLCGAANEPVLAKAPPKTVPATALAIAALPPSNEVKGVVPTRPAAPFAAQAVRVPSATLGQGYEGEVEPNDTPATASPINLLVRGTLFPNGDVDYYKFNAAAGSRVYAAVMTSESAGSSATSVSWSAVTSVVVTTGTPATGVTSCARTTLSALYAVVAPLVATFTTAPVVTVVLQSTSLTVTFGAGP